MKTYIFPKIEKILADNEKSSIKNRVSIADVKYELPNASRVVAQETTSPETEKEEERKAEENTGQEKKGRTKKKAQI